MRKKRLKIAFCFGLVNLLCWAVSLLALQHSNDSLLTAFHVNDEGSYVRWVAQDVVRQNTVDKNFPALRWNFLCRRRLTDYR